MEGYGGPVLQAFVRFIRIMDEEVVLYRQTAGAGQVEAADGPLCFARMERRTRGLIFLCGQHYPLSVVPSPITDAGDLPGFALGSFFQPQVSEGLLARLNSAPVVMRVSDPDELARMVFATAEANGLILVGREMPTRPGAPYVTVRRADEGLFHFGLLTDTALPRSSGAAPTLAGVRLVSPAELASLQADASRPPHLAAVAVSAPSQAAPVGVGSFSQRALEDWYRCRVETWPTNQRPPSLAKDVVAVKGVPGLESVPRRALEALRDRWPTAYRRGGRPAGKPG